MSYVTSATLNNVTFISCQSIQGGAVYTDNANLQIIASNFTLNQAEEAAAVYFSCCQDCADQTEFACSFSFSNSLCTSNSASVQGGCFFTDLYQVQDYQTSKYSNNTAKYGKDYGSEPFDLVRVVFNTISGQWEETSSLLNAVSGQPVPVPFYFAVRDLYSQVISNENSAIGIIAPVDNLLVIDFQDQSVSLGGLFTFDLTEFTSNPGYEGNFSFTSSIINTLSYQKITGQSYEKLNIILSLRLCTYGEAIEGEICSICQAGTYSLVQNAKSCSVCPNHATCYQDQINPDPGYWRSSNVSTQVTMCYYSYACTGGGVKACDSSSGYEGVLCHECIYNLSNSSQQFTRKNTNQCQLCPSLNQNIKIYVLIFMGGQAQIIFLTISYYNNLVKEKENTVLLKIFTTYTQIIGLISSFQLNWPSIIQGFFTSMAAPSTVTQALYSVDCLLKAFQITDPVESVKIELLITTLQPFIQFSFQIFVFFFLWVFRQKKLKLKMFIAMITIYYLTYPKIVQDTFSLFTCTPSIDGVKYLVMNTNIVCFGSTHLSLIAMLALPNMVVWIFGIPCLVLYQLYRRRAQLDDENTLRTLGFWYNGCKRHVFYWDIMQEFKKLMLVSITVDITGMGQSYQAFCMLIVLYGYFILASNLQPYKTEYLNAVSYYAEFAQLCTFAFMMVFLRTSDNPVINNLIFVLLLLMNSLYLLRFLYYYAKFYYYVLLDTWATLKTKLKKAPADENEIKESKEESEFDKITSDDGSSVPVGEEPKKKRKKRKMPSSALYRADAPQERYSTSKKDNNLMPLQGLQPLSRGSSQPPEDQKEEKLKQKIESIRVLKDKKRQIKRRMLIKDGPVSIRIDDYIREEKQRTKWERIEKEVRTQEEEKKKKEEKEEDFEKFMQNFDLKPDKDGKLLSEQNMEKIKKIL